jgi:hypothetical protein
VVAYQNPESARNTVCFFCPLNAEEVIQRALQTLQATHQVVPSKVQECQEASARIRELRKGVTLGGLKIKALIHEGHKY